VLALMFAIIAVVSLAAWTIATNVGDSGANSARAGAPTQASVLRSLTPQERKYVVGITSLSPERMRAAFGTAK
jgi:hypothetical protein